MQQISAIKTKRPIFSPYSTATHNSIINGQTLTNGDEFMHRPRGICKNTLPERNQVPGLKLADAERPRANFGYQHESLTNFLTAISPFTPVNWIPGARNGVFVPTLRWTELKFLLLFPISFPSLISSLFSHFRSYFSTLWRNSAIAPPSDSYKGLELKRQCSLNH
jgi:hypothetical protein